MFKKEDKLVREEIVFFEDEVTQAKKFFAHLNLKEANLKGAIPSVRYLRKLDDLKELFREKGVIRIYWVDINLGKGRVTEGIDAIKAIRENDSDALIIVYSGYPDREHECLDAGADLFFEKDPVTYEDDLCKIRNTILRAFREWESWEKVVNMYTQVVDIDEERKLIRLNCKLEKDSNETFERAFPLSLFKNSDKLTVNQSIHVQTLERAGEIRFLFENTNEDYFEEEEDIDISDLDDSPIFKTKDT